VVIRKSNKAVCPSFGNNASLRVLILPLRQTGALQNEEPELEIMDGLNKYIAKTPGLSAIADVNEYYDIDENYPNPEEAAQIARNCNAQMIVWGRFNQKAANDYRLDVQYKLLDASGVRAGGDTTINRLLTVTDQGAWTHDAAAVVRLLYTVIANQAHVRIASEVMDELAKPDLKSASSVMDTTIGLVLADAYIMNGQPEKAVAVYDQIIQDFPEQKTALTKRGALLFEQKDFKGAARDLEAAAPDPKSIDPHLQELRIDAYLKSGQPEKAGQDIETMQEKGVKDEVWINTKKEELLNVSTKLLQELKPLNELAASPKASDKTRIKAGRANLATGDNNKAIKNAENILDHNPLSSDAIALKVEALVAKGDTGLALDLLQQAQKAGVALKELELAPRTKAAVKSKLPEKQ
jgi:tetratricopeptide (TPR) repeat protein